VFDLSPVRDDRPLFFEQTRADRPDTWPPRSAYGRAIELCWLALGSWMLGAVLGARSLRSAIPRAPWVAASASLLGLAHGTTIVWTTQATGRLLAEVDHGALVAAVGISLGGGLGLWLSSLAVGAGRSRVILLAAALSFGLLATAGLHWSALVDATPRAQATPAAASMSIAVGALCALPLAGLLRSVGPLSARSIAPLASCHLSALLASVAFANATVLFLDLRALGVEAGVSGALSALLCGLDRPRANG
jgi:hypothetical protein